MSLASWKAEFYPVEASQVLEEDAVDHSIRKWEGLQPENLEKHNVTIERYLGLTVVVNRGLPTADAVINGGYLGISSHTCALCAHFQTPATPPDEACAKCPLALVRHGVRCDEAMKGVEAFDPFTAFTRGGDPEPMLVQLRLAKKL